MHRIAPAALLAVALVATGAARENPRAARSVHLAYHSPEAVAFYNEMTIEASVAGSYFMACGFVSGYFGLQELGGGRKIALFSIWDPGDQNDPRSVPADQQVEVLSQGSNVTVRRFGGEGTGAQCLRPFAWQTGQVYRFLVTAQASGKTTTFRGQLFDPAVSNWIEMATFRTQATGRALRGLYSFVEDFRRDGASVQERRSALFQNAWVQVGDGAWKPVTRADFSADGNVHTNIDAKAVGAMFQLATGGDTTMSRPLWSRMDVPPSPAPPPDLPIRRL